MDPEEKRIRELMADLNNFCLSHDMVKNNCEKCPFGNYEDCPLCKFYIECSFAIYNI